MQKLFTHNLKGFTLVEALVSTFIITMVVIGPLTIALKASAYAKQTKDTMTALYLAQEGLELLRNNQDTLYLHCSNENDTTCIYSTDDVTPGDAAWSSFKNRFLTPAPKCVTGTPCTYDFIGLSDGGFTLYTPGTCPILYIQETTHQYVCSSSGNIPTTFSRTVVLEDKGNKDILVTVSVSFKMTTGFSRTVQVEGYLHARP